MGRRTEAIEPRLCPGKRLSCLKWLGLPRSGLERRLRNLSHASISTCFASVLTPQLACPINLLDAVAGRSG